MPSFVGGTRHAMVAVSALALMVVSSGISGAAEPDRQAKIEDALSAAPPAVRKTARVMDHDGTVLKEGSGTYTCMPTAPSVRDRGPEPMCLDEVWLRWADAWMHKKPFSTDRVGVAYMLAGDAAGASNIDPHATTPTADNQWVIEGPHVMIIVPDAAQLDGLPDKPDAAGAYVMWKGTPYAHIMVPVAARPAQ